MTALTGKNCCLNSSTVEVFLNDEPQSTSTKNLVHLAQSCYIGAFIVLTPMKMMVLDRFSGYDPEGWILRAEQYFTYLGFSEQDWLPLPSFYLDGEALTWFTWLHHNKQFFNWRHFTEKLLMRFPRRTFTDSVSMPYSSRAYVDHVHYATSAPPATFISTVAPPSHVTNSSNLEVAFTSGNSEAYHMLEKLPEKYTSEDSLVLGTGSSTEIAPLDGLETPQIRSAKSIEADLVQEPSSLTEAQVFDEISQTTVSSSIPELKETFCEDVSLQTMVPTAVSDDTKGSHSVEEENSQEDVGSLDNTPQRDASGFLVPFAKQGTKMSNACSRLAEIEYPFVDTFWLHTIHNSLEESRGGNQNGVPLCLGFRSHKCNWVDTGQECPLPGFLLFGIGAHRNYDRLALSLDSVLLSGWIAGSRTISFWALLHSTPTAKSDEKDSDTLIRQRIAVSFRGKKIVEALCCDNFFLENEVFILTSELHYVEVYLKAENEKFVVAFTGQHILSQFPIVPTASFLTVATPMTAVAPCVWDPGIGFEFMALTSYTVNKVEELLLLGCTGKFFLITYSNSMSRVWDPGQPWCVNSCLSNECSIVYNCILFTCPSNTYTPILDEYYYDVKHEVSADNFKHTSVLHLHDIIVLATMLREWKVIVLRSGYKVKLLVDHPSAGYTLYGVIELLEWAAHRRLHHGFGTALVFVILLNKCMIAGQVIIEIHSIMLTSFPVIKKEHGCNWLISVSMERFGRRRASNTIHGYLKVNNSSFDESDHVKEHYLYHVSSAFGASFVPNSSLGEILSIPLFNTTTYNLVKHGNISFDRKGNDAKEKWSKKGIATPTTRIRELLLENMTKVPYVAANNASTRLGDTKPSKGDEFESAILQSKPPTRLLPLKIFTRGSQSVYTTPSYQIKCPDMNLEDKVLFDGGSIVVNHARPIGPIKMMESFIWDPGPISILIGLKRVLGLGRRVYANYLKLWLNLLSSHLPSVF